MAKVALFEDLEEPAKFIKEVFLPMDGHEVVAHARTIGEAFKLWGRILQDEVEVEVIALDGNLIEDNPQPFTFTAVTGEQLSVESSSERSTALLAHAGVLQYINRQSGRNIPTIGISNMEMGDLVEKHVFKSDIYNLGTEIDNILSTKQ